MYVRKILTEQIINLFTSEPEYRDDRWGTIEFLIANYYRDEYGKNILSTAKLVFDIDRGFRYVQQHIPKLRGKTWLKRQLQAGEISKSHFESMKDVEMENDVKDLCKQLKMDFE